MSQISNRFGAQAGAIIAPKMSRLFGDYTIWFHSMAIHWKGRPALSIAIANLCSRPSPRQILWGRCLRQMPLCYGGLDRDYRLLLTLPESVSD